MKHHVCLANWFHVVEKTIDCYNYKELGKYKKTTNGLSCIIMGYKTREFKISKT